MQYLDDDARSDYFKASGTLQAVLSIFDFMCKAHGHEIEMITVETRQARLSVLEMPVDIGRILVAELNQRFARYDNRPTAEWLDESLGILTVKVSLPSKFRYIL